MTTSFVIDQTNVACAYCRSRLAPESLRAPPVARVRFPDRGGAAASSSEASFDAREVVEVDLRAGCVETNSPWANRARDAGRERERETREGHPRRCETMTRMIARRRATHATRLDATRRDGRAGNTRVHGSRARGGRADGRMDGRRHARGRDDAGQ